MRFLFLVGRGAARHRQMFGVGAMLPAVRRVLRGASP